MFSWVTGNVDKNILSAKIRQMKVDDTRIV